MWVFSTFNGNHPVLLITEPEMINEVMIKQFDVFPNRIRVKAFEPKYFRKNVSTLRDEEWKRTRNMLTPTFTGAKLKKMAPMINEIGTHICSKFERVLHTAHQEFELLPTFRACTMDIICNIVFGISVDSEVKY